MSDDLKMPTAYRPAPSFNSAGTIPYDGVQVRVVEAGTKITDTRTGKTEVVPESGAVFADRTMYCTQKTFDRIKEQVPSKG